LDKTDYSKYLPCDTRVMVHSLGENTPGEFRAVVRGVSATYPLGCVYILEMIDKFDSDYPYSHCGMVSACVREDLTVVSDDFWKNVPAG
jgi:hypothetical protein